MMCEKKSFMKEFKNTIMARDLSRISNDFFGNHYFLYTLFNENGMKNSPLSMYFIRLQNELNNGTRTNQI